MNAFETSCVLGLLLSYRHIGLVTFLDARHRALLTGMMLISRLLEMLWGHRKKSEGFPEKAGVYRIEVLSARTKGCGISKVKGSS